MVGMHLLVVSAYRGVYYKELSTFRVCPLVVVVCLWEVTSGRFPLNWNKLQIHFYTFEWGLFESVVFL